MSKKALYLLGIAITIILGTFLYVKFCCNCTMKTPAVDTEKVPVATVQDDNIVPFILNGSGIDYHTNDNIKFLKNSFAVILPVSDSVSIGIGNLKTFLIANPKQKVTITGYATSDETNTTTFENLGLARANDIKKYFVSKGLSDTQFDTKGEVIDKWKTNADTLFGPAEYKFAALEATPAATDEWGILKEKINGDPLILHFNTNKSSDKLTDVEKQKVADLVKYMEHVKDAVILAVGHSDNVGNRDSNVVLGQKRAEFSKNYLSKNGIESTRITTESKGPDEPIGENTTAEGKANNRRTVITIK
ncbi:OmpA family protein [Flavobacterium pectinovorum]|uniref:Flagellar motor protein MotB n=1 Tax=Flavobacterium pectinovorum TaxID=29533 RepID=A0A502EJC3_9FLAO|nr:OmpA family protein [Flavobacterium pectinovorum]TPG37597.1 flagellar motor protein MotB [Flavobacterium pectinovorum]